MGMFSRPSESENGYGEQDERMADALRSAGTAGEADQIARDNGLKDAEDAMNWLRERS